jgi:hypothetical protein
VLIYFIFDAIKKDTIDGSHGKPEEKKNIERLLVGKPKGKKHLGRPRLRWDNT